MGKNTLKILGSVQTILAGRVTDADMKSFNEDFRFALGGGSYAGLHGIGETMVIDGKPYVSWIDGGKLHTESQGDFQCAFLMGIDRQQVAAVSTYFMPAKPVSMQTMYADLTEKYPEGFAILGSAMMAELHAVYLKKPPIFHENINDLQKEYWGSEGVKKEQSALFFGVVIPEQTKAKFASVLSKAFYHNPGDTQNSPFDSHTHVALLQSEKTIVGVRHMHTQTLIREGIFTLYPIGNISCL